MLFNIKWVEKKNNDWLVANLIEGAVAPGSKAMEYTDVSINRVGKRGDVFPGFDEIQPGRDVQGEIWQSEKGKWYLFPPKAEKTHGGAYSSNKTASITKAMEKKEQSIEKFQTSKEESIRQMAAQRDAVLIVSTLMQGMRLTEKWATDEGIQEEIIKWRNWFLSDKFDAPPF